MANRSRGGPGRSKKRRRRAPAGSAPAQATPAQDASPAVARAGASAKAAASAAAGAATAERTGARRGPGGTKRRRARNQQRPARGRSAGTLSDMLPLGERPHAPWHPLPLSELLILFGAIGFFFGLKSGLSNGGPPLIAGLVAVLVGTVEVTLREHLSGYRSHAILLAALPVIVLDTALVLLIAPIGAGVKVALLLFDAALFAFVYKLLRARFIDARRERVLAGGR